MQVWPKNTNTTDSVG